MWWMFVRNRLQEGSGSVLSPRRITFMLHCDFHSGGIRGRWLKITLLAKSFSNRWYTMTFGAMTRKFVERSESFTMRLWKYDQTAAMAMTIVLPEPVAILNA